MKTLAWIFVGCWIATLCICQVTMADAGSPGILSAHQVYRVEVGSPPLVYSDSIAAGAQDWADYLAANALFKHSGSN